MNFGKKYLKCSLDMGFIFSAYSTMLHAVKVCHNTFLTSNTAVLTYFQTAFFLNIIN